MKIKSFLAIAVLATAILCFGAGASAQTTDAQALIVQLQAQIQSLLQQLIVQLQAQIQSLLQQIAAIQAQQNAGTEPDTSATPWCHTFNANMGYGATGSDFNALITVLDKENIMEFTSGNRPARYNENIGGGIVKLQAKYGIMQTGYFGPLTRAKLNGLYGCSKTTPPESTCTPNWTCSSWSNCTNNQQTRYCYDTNYCGVTAGTPAQTQSCVSTIECTESNWIYTVYPADCPSSGTQTKYWSKIGSCAGGTAHNTSETASCNYQTPTCTSFTYSDWSACNSSGIQTRTVTWSYPANCSGGAPVTSQTCTYTPTCTESNWTYTVYPADCPSSGTQTKYWSKIGSCAGGTAHNTSESVSCNYQTPTCTFWTYSNWSACSSSGIQTRTVTWSYPANCSGGAPVTSQTCTYTPTCTESNWTYTLSPSTCPSSGYQTKYWTSVSTCQGGVTHPSSESVSCNYQTPTCTSWTYSDWSACSSSGTQTRTVVSSSPSGCAGGSPITSQTCTYVPACTESNWTYILSPSTCPSSGYQTKYWTVAGNCQGGVTHPSSESVSCNYQTPTCTSWTYSDWSACSSSGTRTRTITSFYPAGCQGGNPILTESCTYTPLCTESNWTYILSPSTCPSSGYQTKYWTVAGNCQGGVTHPSSESVSCNYQTPTCTSWTYSNWSTCSSSGTQTRTVVSSSPSGCTGGNPVLSQSCVPQWVCGNTLTDTRDSKTYATVQIGSQCWMAKNLDYDNGCASITWVNSTDVGWCGYYTGGPFANEGLLYQWSAAMAGSATEPPARQGICPTGWHVPSDAEWYTLENGLWDGVTGACSASRSNIWDCSPAGDKLKASGLCEGRTPCGTSGFNGLLAGYRDTFGSFFDRPSHGYFWFSTQFSSSYAWLRGLYVGTPTVARGDNLKAFGFSVRCLKN